MKKKVTQKYETKVVDAAGKSFGRLASEVALILCGKNKASYQPHLLCGDGVLVKNISGMRVTGKKEQQKVYVRHSGYLGSLRTELLRDLKAQDPGKLLKMSVRKMLPDNKLRKEMLKRLTIE